MEVPEYPPAVPPPSRLLSSVQMITKAPLPSTATCGSGGGSPPPACLRGTGGKFFGSVVVEGDVNIAGSPHLVYVTSNVDSKSPLSATTRFARVSGSWLDDTSGF